MLVVGACVVVRGENTAPAWLLIFGQNAPIFLFTYIRGLRVFEVLTRGYRRAFQPVVGVLVRILVVIRGVVKNYWFPGVIWHAVRRGGVVEIGAFEGITLRGFSFCWFVRTF